MKETDIDEVRALIDYFRQLLTTVQEPVPRAVYVVGLGMCDRVIEILDKAEAEADASEECGSDCCEL